VVIEIDRRGPNPVFPIGVIVSGLSDELSRRLASRVDDGVIGFEGPGGEPIRPLV
jgi:hypothetical protein